MTYPRIYVSQRTHAKIKKIARKSNKTMKEVGRKVVDAGIKALGL